MSEQGEKCECRCGHELNQHKRYGWSPCGIVACKCEGFTPPAPAPKSRMCWCGNPKDSHVHDDGCVSAGKPPESDGHIRSARESAIAMGLDPNKLASQERLDAETGKRIAPEPESDGVPEGLPEKWRKSWACADLLPPPGGEVLRDALSDLAAATKRAEELEVEHDHIALDLGPNPRCTHGPHPLACADKTDPEGRCLWCGDVARAEDAEQARDEWKETCMEKIEERDKALASACHHEARAEAAEAKVKELEAANAVGLHPEALAKLHAAEARCKELEEANGQNIETGWRMRGERDEAREDRDHHAANVRRLQAELAVANAAGNRLRAENERMANAILWALGENDAFEPPEMPPGKKLPPYWWRKELRARAALAGTNQSPPLTARPLSAETEPLERVGSGGGEPLAGTKEEAKDGA